MIKHFNSNFPKKYWINNEKIKPLFYRREKMIKLVKNVDRIRCVVEDKVENKDVNSISESLLQKVFSHFVVGNSKLTEIYQKKL